MAPPTLYHASSSFYSQRARLAFAEKKLKCKQVEVAIRAGEHLEPWYARVHPLMTVPGMTIDGGTQFIDSVSIIGYLDQLTPELPPLILDENTVEGKRCVYYQQLLDTITIGKVSYCTCIDDQFTRGFKSFLTLTAVKNSILSTIDKANCYSERYIDLRYEYMNKATALSLRLEAFTLDTTKTLRDELDNVEKILGELETDLEKIDKDHEGKPLNDRPWLCCQHFTVGDIYLATLLHRLAFLGYSHFWTDGKRAHIDQYYQRVLNRDTFRKSCRHANSIFWGMKYPTIKYKLRQSVPWVLGASVIVGGAAMAAYIYYRK